MKRPEEIPIGQRGPGYQRAPQHRVAFIPSTRRVRVKLGDAELADCRDVVVVEEGGYPPRYYLRRDDVRSAHLVREEQVTFCPFKGLARYYGLQAGERRVEHAAWSYRETYVEAELLRDRIAFDDDKVELLVEEPGAA